MRSDCDGEAEDEAAEIVECVAAGFTLMPRAVRRYCVPDGAAAGDVGWRDCHRMDFPDVNVLRCSNGTWGCSDWQARAQHADTIVHEVSQDDVAFTINHEIVGTVEACLAHWDIVYDKSPGVVDQLRLLDGSGARKCPHTPIHEDYANSMLTGGRNEDVVCRRRGLRQHGVKMDALKWSYRCQSSCRHCHRSAHCRQPSSRRSGCRHATPSARAPPCVLRNNYVAEAILSYAALGGRSGLPAGPHCPPRHSSCSRLSPEPASVDTVLLG